MQRVYLENKQASPGSKDSLDADLTPSPSIHKKDESNKKILLWKNKLT